MSEKENLNIATLFNKMNYSDYDDIELSKIFEQYKIMVESTDRISDKRATANQFFLSVLSFMLGIIGVVSAFSTQEKWILGIWILFISITGIILCIFWHRTIESYRQLNKCKFIIIHMIEQDLPLRIFDYEWKILGKGKNPKTYHPLTNLEKIIPILFISIFICMLLFGSLLIYISN